MLLRIAEPVELLEMKLGELTCRLRFRLHSYTAAAGACIIKATESMKWAGGGKLAVDRKNRKHSKKARRHPKM